MSLLCIIVNTVLNIKVCTLKKVLGISHILTYKNEEMMEEKGKMPRKVIV